MLPQLFGNDAGTAEEVRHPRPYLMVNHGCADARLRTLVNALRPAGALVDRGATRHRRRGMLRAHYPSAMPALDIPGPEKRCLRIAVVADAGGFVPFQRCQRNLLLFGR